MNYKLRWSVASATALGGTLVYVAFRVGESDAHWLSVGIMVLGASVGWLLGIFLSPYSKKDEREFKEYAGAFGLFASGYLVSKIDKLLAYILDKDFILDSVHGFRVIGFATALILGMIITVIFRRWAD